ncbi:molecular chaperone [Sutterella sp.]|uniref:TorD/DmsD family molecular chaperone n=1 Tax=Sutterella sp. TaxID=1981025 RepID=UPI0026E0EC51|nr:molecular chaperone TorD family protein [Sutterella sp.]MDO5531666.1 molecular chaperone TorD family protein [Sutterella sp.]
MQDLINALQARQLIYKVLSGLYQIEVDEEELRNLKGLEFPVGTGSDALDEGSRKLNAAVATLTKDDLDELAADYARVFLSAGIADGPAAYPFESVYTSRDKLIMQDAYEQMLKILKEHGMGTSKEDLYPDHLGIELEFMSFLTEKAVKALEAGKEDEAAAILDEEKEFLTKHLLNWTGKFFDDFDQCAGTDFYKALSLFTRAFIAEDAKWLLD